MKKKGSTLAAALLTACAAWGQSSDALSFEVDSVKQATPDPAQPRRRPTVGTDRVEFRNVTLWY